MVQRPPKAETLQPLTFPTFPTFKAQSLKMCTTFARGKSEKLEESAPVELGFWEASVYFLSSLLCFLLSPAASLSLSLWQRGETKRERQRGRGRDFRWGKKEAKERRQEVHRSFPTDRRYTVVSQQITYTRADFFDFSNFPRANVANLSKLCVVKVGKVGKVSGCSVWALGSLLGKSEKLEKSAAVVFQLWGVSLESRKSWKSQRL